MSGYKRTVISIPEEEKRLLKLAEEQLYLSSKDWMERREQERLNPAIFQSMLDEMQARQGAFSQALTHLDDTVSRLETETSQVLLEQQTAIFRQIDASAAHSQSVTLSILEDQEQHFQSEITALQQQQHRQLTLVFHRLQTFEDAYTLAAQRATDYLQAGIAFVEFTGSTYDHERFAPGELAHHSETLIMAEENLNLGLAEAALTGAQTAYTGLSELRVRLERMQNEFSFLLQMALEETARLQSLAQEVQSCQAWDHHGKLLAISLEVAYWSNGLFSQALRRLAKISRQLEICPLDLGIDSLRDLIEQQLPEIQWLISQAILTARQNALRSQLRITIADLAAQALEQQGFELTGAGYQAKDKRSEYQAVFKDDLDNEVIIHVVPGEDFSHPEGLEIESLDSVARSHHELVRRAQEICAAMQAHGLDVGVLEQRVPRQAKPKRPSSAHTLTRSYLLPQHHEEK